MGSTQKQEEKNNRQTGGRKGVESSEMSPVFRFGFRLRGSRMRDTRASAENMTWSAGARGKFLSGQRLASSAQVRQ